MLWGGFMISKIYKRKLIKFKEYSEYSYFKYYLLFGVIPIFKKQISFNEYMEMDYKRGEK